MRARDRRIALTVAVLGAAGSVAAVTRFISTMVHNGLPWPHSGGGAVRDHYLAVGRFYSQGFAVGFLLAFSLTIAAVAIGSWVEQHRRRARALRGASQSGSSDQAGAESHGEQHQHPAHETM